MGGNLLGLAVSVRIVLDAHALETQFVIPVEPLLLPLQLLDPCIFGELKQLVELELLLQLKLLEEESGEPFSKELLLLEGSLAELEEVLVLQEVKYQALAF